MSRRSPAATSKPIRRPRTTPSRRAAGPFTRHIDEMPPEAVLDEIDRLVDMQKLEETLMSEGLAKFADPQKALLELIGEKRAALASG